MIQVVLKLGGSLVRGDGLPILCRQVAKLGLSHPLLVVPGGGPFADTVRNTGSRYELSDSATHWMAVLAMDQYGYLLSDLIPQSEPVEDLASARNLALAGKVPVFVPYNLLRRADPLPRKWAVTSDSISAWVANLVGASRLVLLKDVDGLYAEPYRGKGGGNPLASVTLELLAESNGVDPFLATVIKESSLDLWIMNGNEAHRLEELLTTEKTHGTRLQR